MNIPVPSRGDPLPDPKAQQRAASDPAASVWVSASAGSGKTTILTSRVTRLLLAGVRPERILCLTFTRAAAAEMALRIAKDLGFWAVCNDNDLNERLSDLQGYAPSKQQMTRARRLFAEALACPGGMRIRTLHAFGQEILRRFPVESGLPPHFTVIEEDDARTMQDESLTDLLREAAAQPDSAVAGALSTLIDRLGENGLRDTVRQVLHERARLAKTIAGCGSLDALIQRMRSTLGLAPEDSEKTLLRAAFETPVFPETEIRAAAELLLQGTSSFSRRGEFLLSWLGRNAEERAASYKEYQGCFLKQDGDFFSAYGDKKLLARHPDLDRVLRREATRLRSLDERHATAATAAITGAALVFGQALIERYAHRKNLQAVLDYDDLVHETLNLLQRPGIAPWILHKLDDGLDHLLVDEAQDTSRAQWDIVATLSDEFFAGAGARGNHRTLFIVGDEKQSIYSFQNADPEAFATMRDFFKTKIEAAGKSCSEIPLRVSFRSAPAILRAVDAVFAQVQAAKGVAAVPIEHISYKRDELFGRVELWPLLPAPKAGKGDKTAWDLPIGYETERDPQVELAGKIAATIKGWLARGETLPGCDRPIRPGDVMILLRRRGRFADLMVRALKQKPNAIPVTGVDRMHLMRQLPVMDLLALIQFALLSEDDLNLAAVLRGPLLNLSEDDLMTLAAKRENVSLWQSLKTVASQSKQPFTTAYDYLSFWLAKADFMTPFVMLASILNEPCPASPISGKRALWMRLGLDALDPIEELLNAAQNFSRRHTSSLQIFLHWLTVSDSEIKRELDHGDADEIGGGQVRIMTVHASKGLEAPIVFLPDTATVPRVQDVPKFLWADDLPFYLAGNPNAGTLRQTWNKARERQLQEYRRLLYVAMTRASCRLYIGGWEPKKKEADGDGCWHNLIKSGLKESEAGVRPSDDGVIVWEDPVLPAEPELRPGQILPEAVALPAWAFQPAPLEKAAARPMAPSTLAAAPSAATPDRAFARGRIIHRLLQSLPDVEEARREEVARRFLAHPQNELNEAQQDEVRNEVMNLLRRSDFAPLFGPTSRAEVPLAGSIGGREIVGQADRLALLENEVWIVDYKTNRPPPTEASAIPAVYRAQMEAYRSVLQAIYPGRTVRCFLLWTYGPMLMEVMKGSVN